MIKRQLTKSEVYRLVNDYIGVQGGYLGNFSYRTHEEFYPYYCGLEIDPNQYQGTTRERFTHILSNADSQAQAKILRGLFKKMPVVSFPKDERSFKQEIYDDFQKIIDELEGYTIESDEIILKVAEILNFKGRFDLASLLRGASHHVEVGSTYGSRLHSLLSTVEIYVPITRHEQCEALDDDDRHAIIKAFHVIYPVKPREPEIYRIEFFVDPQSSFPTNSRPVSTLHQIDFDFITQQVAKCDDKIIHGDFEGAITNARSLIESICKYVLDDKEIEFDENADLPELYKIAAKELNMHPEQHIEQSLKQILGGCFNIVNGLGAIRNKMGDAHGKSPRKRYRPDKRHSVLAVSAAKALADFIYSSHASSKSNKNNH